MKNLFTCIKKQLEILKDPYIGISTGLIIALYLYLAASYS